MLIAPPTGGQKRHFLRLAELRLAGILTSCSSLDKRLCGAYRTASGAYPDVHTCEDPFMAACSFNLCLYFKVFQLGLAWTILKIKEGKERSPNLGY